MKKLILFFLLIPVFAEAQIQARHDSITSLLSDSIAIKKKMYYKIIPTITEDGDLIHKSYLETRLAGFASIDSARIYDSLAQHRTEIDNLIAADLDSTNFWRTKSNFTTNQDTVTYSDSLKFMSATNNGNFLTLFGGKFHLYSNGTQAGAGDDSQIKVSGNQNLMIQNTVSGDANSFGTVFQHIGGNGDLKVLRAGYGGDLIIEQDSSSTFSGYAGGKIILRNEYSKTGSDILVDAANGEGIQYVSEPTLYQDFTLIPKIYLESNFITTSGTSNIVTNATIQLGTSEFFRVLDVNAEPVFLISTDGSNVTGTSIKAANSSGNVGLDLNASGTINIQGGKLVYGSPYPEFTDVGDVLPKGMLDTLISDLNTSATVRSPGAGQDGQALVWDNGNNRLTFGSAGGGVTSFEGRTGVVTAQSGDYLASEVTNAFDKSVDDAADVPYTPTTTGDWPGTDPDDVEEALDSLASRNPTKMVCDTLNLGSWDMSNATGTNTLNVDHPAFSDVDQHASCEISIFNDSHSNAYDLQITDFSGSIVVSGQWVVTDTQFQLTVNSIDGRYTQGTDYNSTAVNRGVIKYCYYK